MNRFRKSLVLSAAIVLASYHTAASLRARTQSDKLDEGFLNPPDSAKPRVWWHWTNGNVTKEGITKDEQWMRRVGIGGMHLADVAAGGGQTIPEDQRIVWGSPRWLDAVHHAAAEADRLGLEMSIFSSAGWSETGGPKVKPQQAMKKLVWSETVVQGRMQFDRKLPQPPSSNGVFGNLGAGRGAAAARAGRGFGRPPDPTFYGDSAVIAYRTPDDEMPMAALHPKVTTSGADINAAPLMDDNLNTSSTIAAAADGGPVWVQYEFAQPITARAITLVAPGRGVPFGRVEVSDDGAGFRSIVELPGAEQYRAATIKTYAFPATRARFFRVTFTAAAPRPADEINQTPPLPAGQYQLAEFIVHTGARVDRWQEKAAFNFFYQYEVAPTPDVPLSSAIPMADVVALTSKMDKDGTLKWDVPPGKWTILRMGYSLTGAKNRPAAPSATGFEVDKLNRKYVEEYFHGYFDPIAKELGPLVGKSLLNINMDSFEGGMQNWTDDMIDQFKTRRGYDPTPYLPVLTGRIVGNADISDRFLWDFRRTIADLLAEAHYGTITDMAHQRGMTTSAEANGVSMEFMEDTLLDKKQVDVPMGEFWVHALHPELEYYVDVRGAASASHIYGKKLVGTESFTGGGYESPFTLKKIGDYWMAQGANLFIYHSSAQQPLDTKPGNTMVGTHINRNITWAEEARPYFNYVARNSYMLQQGLFVADVAYLLNEGAPSSQPFWGAGLQPMVPDGYDYDCINADVLLNHMSIGADGRIMLPDGMSYRVLVLPEIDRMCPELLAKIRDLVAGGAIVVGPKPRLSPSLEGGYPRADAQVKALANEIWGDLDGVMRNKHYYGKGLVTWGLPLSQVLESIKLPPDAEFSKPLDSNTVWIHRRDSDSDIYFVVNRTDKAQDLDARFRVSGKEPELWHAETGAIEPVGYSIAGGRTTVPVHLAPRESVFVVFRRLAGAASRTFSRSSITTLATLGGSWEISFPPNFGAPQKIELARLESWTANADPGVKYFSGTATYAKTLSAPASWFTPGAKLVLDLGVVDDLARVSVNGKALGALWKLPYQVDITDALKPGHNQLEIKVTNEWSNRILGDRLGPANKRVLAPGPPAFGGSRGGAATGPPDSGLLGPVTVLAVDTNPKR